jgi:hypothetical protein
VEDDDNDGNLLDSHSQPLNNEELAELHQLTMEETSAAAATAAADDDDEGEIHTERGLTLNSLREVFEKADEVDDYFKDKYNFYV